MSTSFARYSVYRLFVALATLSWALYLLLGGELTRPAPFFRVVWVSLGVLVVVLVAVRNRQVSRGFLLTQLALDALLVSILSDMTGGLHSFFTLLYFPTIGAGAYVLRRGGALWTATFATVGFLGVLALQQDLIASREELLVVWSEAMFRIFAFFLMAILTGQLGEQLARAGAELLAQQRSTRLVVSERDTVLDRVHAGVVATNTAGVVVSVNPFGVQLFGEIAGRPVGDVLPGSLRGEGTWEELRADGQRWVCTSAALSEGGSVLVVEDVTEMTKMREAAARDERMVEAGRLAASLAHEIRNPLASMSGSLQLLREERPSRLVDLALGEAERLNRLVEDFLDVSKRPVVVPRRVDIHAIATEVCEAFSRDPRYAATVKVTCEGHPAIAFADPDRIRQALWNLILNGAQAMPRGGEVTVSVVPRGSIPNVPDGVEVTVTDRGIGIAPKDRPKVFDPFYTTRNGGTGLGLLLVERIARGHGGHISVHGRPTGGTEFNLWLPREALHGA
jgi:two-component system sensor histidine kinase PilS (NtrC family)